MKRPFVLIGSVMFLSLFVFSYCGFYAAAAVFGVSAVLFSILYWFRNRGKYGKPLVLACAALMLSSSCFALKTVSSYLPAVRLCSGAARSLSGELVEYETNYGRYFYTLKNVRIDGVAVKPQIRVNASIYRRADVGDTLSFSEAVLYELGASEETALNYKANGIYVGAYTYTDFLVEKADSHTASYYLDSLRKALTHQLSAHLHSSYAGVCNALLTGNKSTLDYDTELNFRYAGVAHLFAVSGFHLTLWTSLITAVLDKFFGERKKISALFSIVFLLFFMALTGFSKSVMRARIMLLLMIFGKLIKFRADSLNSLFIALTILLLANPFAVMSLSLQMSFLAAFGLILIAPSAQETLKKLYQKIKFKPVSGILSFFYTTLLFSITTTLFTMPVSVCRFGYFSLAAPLTNLLCLLPAQILMPLSALGIVFSPFSAISSFLFTTCAYLCQYLLNVTTTVAHFPHAVVYADSVPMQVFAALLFALLLLLLLLFQKNHKRLRIGFLLVTALFFAVSAFSAVKSDREIKITVADAGNGTAVLLQIDRKNILIGCGGSPYKEYNVTKLCDGIHTRFFDWLLIPRSTSTESLYDADLLNRYTMDHVIAANEDFSDTLTKHLPDDTTVTNACILPISESTTLEYINQTDFTGARLCSDGFSCVILFRPTSDFSSVPLPWQTADLLITRQSLPDTDLSGFRNIFLSTSNTAVYDNASIVSTNTNGTLTLTAYRGKLTIKEEKHDFT